MPEGFRERYGPFAAVLGAGQGIGLAFAREIARRGLGVLAVDVREEGVEAACAAAEAEGAKARGARLDLAAEGAERLLAEAAEGLDLGLLVVPAARSPVGPFLETPLARHLEALAVNGGGALRACHGLGGRLAARGRGGIVLLSSLAGFQGTGHVATYAATKAFTLALAEALWWELRPRGVDVVALAPSSTDTPGFRAHGPRIEAASLASADEVAREGLDGLGGDPVVVPGEAARRIREALASLPRARAVELVSAQTRALYEPPSEASGEPDA